jgi:hypothetical protein
MSRVRRRQRISGRAGRHSRPEAARSAGPYCNPFPGIDARACGIRHRKRGNNVRFEHVRSQLNGGDYGSYFRYYKAKST